MNKFSKKADVLLLTLSICGLLLSSLLILFSANFTNFIKIILETKIFHRTFDISKWIDTIAALIAFPFFIVITIDSVFFVKFANRSKIILLSVLFILCAGFTFYCSYTRCNQFMDSDMASEILLAKECGLQKTFWPRSWNYSTEIRLLNTQIFAAPIFAFTSNWITVKSVSGFFLCLLLPLSLLFLLRQLKIKSVWVKILSCLLLYCPWSEQMWRIVQFGHYYIPHIAISFIYVALFISLSYSELSTKRCRIYLILFSILAFVSGLSGIRYILYFVFPLTITILGFTVSSTIHNNITFSFSNFFIKNKQTFYSCVGLIISGVGYVVNALFLSKLFRFSQFYTTAFTTIGDVTFTDVHKAIFDIFGYKNCVSVFTPSGVTNILLYIALAFLLISIVEFYKKSIPSPQKIFVVFVVVMIIFNSFTYINTEFIGRYFILILVYLIPCFALLITEEKISVIKKYVLGVSFSIVLICNSFITYETVLNKDINTDKYKVASFLEDKNYSFGYATFWNANVFTFITNGKVEIANLCRKEKDNIVHITSEFKCDKWLTPERYYKKDFANDRKVFLLVTNNEYDTSLDLNIFKTGVCVYKDDYYHVFEYSNNQSFKESYNN